MTPSSSFSPCEPETAAPQTTWARVVAAGLRHDRGAQFHMGVSLVLHVGFILAAAFSVPALAETTDARAGLAPETVDYRLLAAVALAAVPGVEEEPPAETEAVGDPDDREPSSSRCGERHGGSMGEPTATPTGHRYGVQGPADNADPHLAREARPRDASLTPFWSVGPLQGHWGTDLAAPVQPWGRDDSLGNDPTSARGAMWGDEPGDASGSPGTGMGRTRLCETCGDTGTGTRTRLATAGGGATGTERSSDVAGLIVPDDGAATGTARRR